jgi:hypothetical protein
MLLQFLILYLFEVDNIEIVDQVTLLIQGIGKLFFIADNSKINITACRIVSFGARAKKNRFFNMMPGEDLLELCKLFFSIHT